VRTPVWFDYEPPTGVRKHVFVYVPADFRQSQKRIAQQSRVRVAPAMLAVISGDWLIESSRDMVTGPKAATLE